MPGVQRAARADEHRGGGAGRAGPRPIWPPTLPRAGVLVSAMDARTLRLVTHHDVSGEACARAAAVLLES